MARYADSLDEDRRYLFGTYRFVDMARKVVGVGSVGTRATVFLLVGRDGKDPLVLQAKEAQASVLEPYLGASEFDNHGERVVRGQRISHAASDIFLSWTRSMGFDGQEHDFYVRQLWDWKASMDLSTMSESGLHAYTRACGWSLARAHARSGDRLAIAAYLGGGSSFDQAIARFSAAYADQNELDHPLDRPGARAAVRPSAFPAAARRSRDGRRRPTALRCLNAPFLHGAAAGDEVDQHSQQRDDNDGECQEDLPPPRQITAAEDVVEGHDQKANPDAEQDEPQHGPEDVKQRNRGGGRSVCPWLSSSSAFTSADRHRLPDTHTCIPFRSLAPSRKLALWWWGVVGVGTVAHGVEL